MAINLSESVADKNGVNKHVLEVVVINKDRLSLKGKALSLSLLNVKRPSIQPNNIH